MRFVDASVFVHAFIKPKRELKPHEVKIREAAKVIVKKINEGEKVGLTVIQLAEIANIRETTCHSKMHYKLKNSSHMLQT